MIDFSDPQNAHLRLSNSERDDAVAQLNANLREGRLDETEFTTRSAVVRTAVTRGDLAPIFSDLPSNVGPATAGQASAPPSGPSFAAPIPGPNAHGPYADPPSDPGQNGYPPNMAGSYAPPPGIADPNWSGSARRGPLGGAAGTVAVSISPFVALILFFLCGVLFGWAYSWLWFLLVPLTAIIVYGAGTRDSDRNRNRNRYR